MARNRISGLGITVLGSSILLALAGACDSGGSTTAPGTGTSTGTGTGTGIVTTGAGGGTGTGTKVTTGTGGAKVNTGTGGAVATGVGGSGNTTSGCGTAPTGTGSLSIAASYITGSNYSGYGFAYVSPSTTVGGTTANCTLGGTNALCAAGTLPADTSYGTVAGIGFNLNQASAANSPTNAISATVASVTVGFTNSGASTLRVQISQGTTYYCFDVSKSTSPVTISASQFNTACWNGSGTNWDGTGASAVQLIVPSQATVPTPFSACLTSVTLS